MTQVFAYPTTCFGHLLSGPSSGRGSLKRNYTR